MHVVEKLYLSVPLRLYVFLASSPTLSYSLLFFHFLSLSLISSLSHCHTLSIILPLLILSLQHYLPHSIAQSTIFSLSLSLVYSIFHTLSPTTQRTTVSIKHNQKLKKTHISFWFILSFLFYIPLSRSLRLSFFFYLLCVFYFFHEIFTNFTSPFHQMSLIFLPKSPVKQ